MKVNTEINRQKGKNRTPRDIEDKVVEMWNQYATDKEISAACGISPRTVYNIIKRRRDEDKQGKC